MEESIKKIFKNAGFDVDGTIQRFAGNEALYEKYIFKFIDDKIFENLAKAVKEGNHANAFQESHTLKGVAGNMGLNALADAAENMVSALRNNQTPPLEPLFLPIEKAYNDVIAVLKANK